ncbi:MAG: carboxypeptidase-like regulatory domain-containing protein [Acidobacteriota bacterium]
MRYAVLLLCVPLFAQTPANTARIEGRVIDVEGRPVANVNVMTGLMTDRQPRSSRTAADGTFAFEYLPPASNYAITAQKPGYLTATLGAGAQGARNALPTPFALARGEIARVELRLIGQGVITGTVTNQSGDPVGQATVVLWQLRYRLGVVEKNYTRIARTDDRGVYRLAELPAGSYVLVAGETNAGSARGDGKANLTTYFHGTQQFTDATPVEVTPGGEARADIALLRGAVYSLRGKLIDESGAPMRQSRVSARRNNDAAFTTLAMTATGADGSFEMHDLMPGNYIVEPDAMFDPQTGAPLPRLAMSTPVVVGAADVTDVVLRPSRTASLTGTIQVEGEEWSPPTDKRRIGPTLTEATLTEPAGIPRTPYAGLTAMDSSINGSYAAEVRADSKFEIAASFEENTGS